MDLLEELESAIESLLTRNTELEAETRRLQEELDRERSAKEAVQARVEKLLEKVRGELG